MKRKTNRENVIIFIIATLSIIIGIGFFCFPYISNYFYQNDVKSDKQVFDGIISNEENNENLDKLYQELKRRNEELYQTKQKGLTDPFSYEQPSIDLKEYGIENNIIGYINIPKMEVELPIILGANKANLQNGAVHLTQTSYPIGGNNTNSVIAAHRGYAKALFFRKIDELKYGDKIYIKNFKEELTYEVKEIKIINPSDINELLIQEGKDLITLITCHPYRVNSQRYLVIAERNII